MPKMRIGMPATKAPAKRTGTSVTAVPRSGCRAMSTSGTTVIAPAISRSLRPTPPRRPSAKNLASTRASVALANSDGCTPMPGIGSHRLAPLMRGPSTRHTTRATPVTASAVQITVGCR